MTGPDPQDLNLRFRVFAKFSTPRSQTGSVKLLEEEKFIGN